MECYERGCVRVPKDRCLCEECCLNNVRATLPFHGYFYDLSKIARHADCTCDWCNTHQPKETDKERG